MLKMTYDHFNLHAFVHYISNQFMLVTYTYYYLISLSILSILSISGTRPRSSILADLCYGGHDISTLSLKRLLCDMNSDHMGLNIAMFIMQWS